MRDFFDRFDDISLERKAFVMDPIGLTPHKMVGTPEDLVACVDEMVNMFGVEEMIRAAPASVPVSGDPSLFQSFSEKLEQLEGVGDLATQSQTKLKKSYSQAHTWTPDKTHINLKTHIGRPLNAIVEGLAKHHGITTLGVEKQLEELFTGNHISRSMYDHIKDINSRYLLQRFETHVENGVEFDKIYTSTASHSPFQEAKNLVDGIKRLQNRAKSFVEQGKHDIFKENPMSFSDRMKNVFSRT